MANVYEIATKITMLNGISPVLALLGKELLGLEGGIKSLTKSFEGMSAAARIALGGVAIVAGTATLGALGKLAEKGKELLNQQEQLQRMGISLADVNRMTADGFARIAKEVPTAQVSEYLKVIRELRGAVGDTGQAEKLAPQALKIQALLANTIGGDQSEAFWQLLRAAEMKGIVTNPQKLQSFIDATVPWILGTGGKVTPGGFQAFARKGGGAWINADLEKALPAMAVAIADLGGPTAGQSMMSLYQFINASQVMSRQQYDIMSKLGLIDPKYVKATGFGGGQMQLKTGAIRGSLSHVGDLPGWVNDVLMPAIDKTAGGRSAAAKAASDDEAFSQSILAKIFRNRNQLRIALMWGMPEFREQIAKDAGIVSQVLPWGEGYQEFITKNPAGVQFAFKQQWESMLSAIGSPLMVSAMPVMQQFTDFFTWFGDWSNKNADTISTIGKVFAGLAIGLVALGATAVISGLITLAGPAGLLYGFAAALSAIAVLNWDQLVWGVKKLDDMFNSISKSISDFFEGLKNLLPDWMLKKDTSFRSGNFGPAGRFSEGRVWPVYYGGMPFGGSYGGSGAAIRAFSGGGGGGFTGDGEYNVTKSYDLIKAAGGTDEEARTLAAIAQAESSGNPLAHNTRGSDNSYGLWQINMLGGMGPSRRAKYGLGSNEDLFDPATNARIALAMHRAAGGYKDWSTFRTGAYSKFLSSGGLAGGQWNFMHGQYGGRGENLTTFTTAGGLRVTANLAAAPHMKGFLEELEIAGAPMRQQNVAAFVNRNIAGGGTSQHAYGNAIDIESYGRNLVHPAFNRWATTHKQQLEAAERHWGMMSGRFMRNPDWGHWEWGGGGEGGQASNVVPFRRSGKKQHQSNINLYLDGKHIASNTVNHILRSSEHSRGAAYFDGYHTFAGADRQTATA